MKLIIKIKNAAGETLAESASGEQVSLLWDKPYEDGDRVVLELDRERCFLVIQLEDTLPPEIIYVPGNRMDYPIPPADNRLNYSPRSFADSRHLVRARCATSEETAIRRDLARNVYDCHGDHGFFPHAKANVETRGEAVFAARNAIDGVFENSSHGSWPYESWGINRDPDAALRLFFGRRVLVDEVRLTLRADFPHDSWWEQVTVLFSDGSKETLDTVKTALPQSFQLKPREIEWLELRELKKAPDESPFPALTELEVFGIESNT